MSKTPTPIQRSRLHDFTDEFGKELEDCNPNAFDLLEEFLEKGERQVLEDFIWYHLDELDACHPDAFDMLYLIAQEEGIEI